MSNAAFFCEVHIKEATLFCLCNSSPVFTCPECLPKHEGHEAYPISQLELFETIGRDTAELKRRNDLYQCCQNFMERVTERETFLQHQAKTLMENVGKNYYLWLEGDHHCFQGLLSTLKEESVLLLTRSKPRVSSVTQKILEKLDPSDSDIGKKFISIPEVETLSHLNDCCQEACSRVSKVWQEDYEDEILQVLTSPHQSKKRKRSLSIIDGEDAQLQLKLEEVTMQLQTLQSELQGKTSLQEEYSTLVKLYQSQGSQLKETKSMFDQVLMEVDKLTQRNTELEAKLEKCEFVPNPQKESQDPIPDYTTPESRAALSKFGPHADQDEEATLVKRGPVVRKTGIYIGQWNTRNKKHGYGKFLWNTGAIYEGQWRNGSRTGKGRQIFATGDVYIGDFIQNKKEGFGTFYSATGNEYSGAWINDKRHGLGSILSGTTSTHPSSRYIGYFLNEMKSGIGAYFWSDGRMYVGSWSLGKMHGKGLYGAPPGAMYIGDYVAGLRSGSGCSLYLNGDVYKGEWKDGDRSGLGRLTHRGTYKEGIWKDGLLPGKDGKE